MNFLCYGFQKLEIHQLTDRETDATERITMPHLRVVINLH